MAKLPGSCGYPIVSDTSIEFYRNPEEYISKRLQESSSKIFQSRLLNYKTVFVCSYDATREILEDKSRDFEHGYRSFLFNSYGDNILFEDGESASHLRRCMLPIFNDFARYESTMEKLCEQFFSSMTSRDSDKVVISNVYETFKTMMTKLCLHLFLDYDDDNLTETTESISELATLHWHGIISVPVSLKVPFAGESGWSKAVAAKEKLLDLIRDKIVHEKIKGTEACDKSVFSSMLNLPFNDHKDIEQHVLLFISALIPKAFSSIITSFIIEMSGEERAPMREKARSEDSFLERVLLEVQRLRPPFFGGRRIAIRDTKIGGYHIPKGHAVVYVSHFAHRDEKVFKNPEKFDPDRWLGWDGPILAADKTFTFGRGERRCIGHKLIHDILWYITKELLKNYDWSSAAVASETPYKLLPVSRPVAVVSMTFERHGP